MGEGREERGEERGEESGEKRGEMREGRGERGEGRDCLQWTASNPYLTREGKALTDVNEGRLRAGVVRCWKTSTSARNYQHLQCRVISQNIICTSIK